VWTGAQALEKKLVDRLGGLYEAIEEAKREASILLLHPNSYRRKLQLNATSVSIKYLLFDPRRYPGRADRATQTLPGDTAHAAAAT
jgi:ClpP class serine protease